MNTLNIGCFMSLAATGNLSSTASLMNISKASVMQNIRRLEEELCVALFISTAPEVRLTEAGKKFVAFFKGFEAKLRNAMTELARAKGASDLGIAWSEYVSCPGWVKRAIGEFGDKNPDVNILIYQASPANLLRLLADGTADIALCSRYLTRGIQRASRMSILDEVPLYLIVARDSGYADMSARSLLSFDVPYYASYAWETDKESVENRVDYEYIRYGYKPSSVRVLENLDSVYMSVRLGNGITACPLNNKLCGAELFECFELPRTVTLCMTRLQANLSIPAMRFESFIEELRDRKGADAK